MCITMKPDLTCCAWYRVFNNAEWWSEVSAVEFASNISRYFRLSTLLHKERQVCMSLT